MKYGFSKKPQATVLFLTDRHVSFLHFLFLSTIVFPGFVLESWLINIFLPFSIVLPDFMRFYCFQLLEIHCFKFLLNSPFQLGRMLAPINYSQKSNILSPSLFGANMEHGDIIFFFYLFIKILSLKINSNIYSIFFLKL